jgi:hypothetical protein
MEKAVCPVCGTVHETGSLLMNMRLKPISEQASVTHYEMCPAHQKLADEDFIALVEVTGEPHSISDANRTGDIAHIRRSVYDSVFNVPAPKGPMAFVEAGVIDKLKELAP